MFYSHEVLTSRQYGVATVWLVATLGQKSTAHKVSRRAILDVDVPKACETVIAPVLPLALRLQSSLLYGISRVYAQQCGYVLSDAQHTQTAIRGLLKGVYNTRFNSGLTKARSDQITLQDDPSFIPDFAFCSLPSELLDLDIGVLEARRLISDSTSLHTTQSQYFQPIGLHLPSSSSPDAEAFQIPGSGGYRPRLSSLLGREDDDILLPEIDIGLDPDGNFIDFDNLLHSSTRRDGNLLHSIDIEAQRDFRGTGQAAHVNGGVAELDAYNGLPLINDGFTLPPPKPGILSDSYRVQQDHSDSMVDTSSTIVAPQRRRARVPKAIPLDRSIELRNRDLLAMNNGYMDLMDADWKLITVSKNTAQAKRNADYWLLGCGIGGVGDKGAFNGIKGPLAEMWSGDNLYLMLTGYDRTTKSKKRVNEDDDSDANRRVRPRLHDDQPHFQCEDDEIMQDYELEIGREGQEALDDISSAMPWNVSASIRGSSVIHAGAGVTGVPGSVAGSLTRRGSRLVSASPLVGYGIASSGGVESPASDMGGLNELGKLIGEGDFELYGPGANVDTQTAGQSQWHKAVLDRECNNFLEFIGSAIDEKRASAGLADRELAIIDFEELLPPMNNSRTVAAQALLHVLTLGTKNLITVTQNEHFATISLEIH